ncbi:nineteen complex-related protein 2-domain-containing protein [Naematelia encephala]|uniref:Nineteen complex-related protein 2-domain-containing protein n=1 Tax=Naematelia encephala TaxID=71784 RepID=A0A1Y2BLE7_9TREE|nr:nineteen complex-related protein 2-domain-containing protein [Naematelia encephala]
MFIKRAKSRPSLRARDADEEPSGSPLAKSSVTAGDAENGADTSMEVDDEGVGSVMERKKAQKKDRRKEGGLSKGASRLSFGGEGEEGGNGTPFKATKSKLSQQIQDKIQSTPSSSGPTVTPSSSSSIYSREYLNQLKAATPTRAPRSSEHADDEEEEQDGMGVSRLARDKYASTFAQDTTAGIPDAAAIASAKTKRLAALEAAKHGGDAQQDYISLGGGQIAVYDGSEGPHPESRLMREEDEDDEGDEDLADYTEAKERLFIGKDANKAASRRLKGEIGELIADREAEDDDDEETREWEEAQARRAGNWEEAKPEKVVKVGYVPTPMPAVRPLPTIAPAAARLAKALLALESHKSENEHALEVSAQELAALEEQEKDLRKEVERVEGKREWVEEYRGWIETLGGFLEEKLPKLEEIEADAVHHLSERAQMVNRRRVADDNDDLALFLGVAPLTDNEVEEVDELGRSRNGIEAGPSSSTRRARRSEREARRIRRRARTNRSTEDDGFSTDSTLAEGDAEDYDIAQDVLDKRVTALLDDVRAEDFRDPEKGVAVRFGDWRRRYEDEYVNAFGGLALVQAWEFWARGEMVGWEPLRGSSPIESFRWFNSLYAYSRPRVHSNGHTQQDDDDDMDLEEEPPLGPDGDLVATMVDRAVVPALIKAFEAGAYDPYSVAQTRRAVDLADVVADLMGKDSRKFTSLLRAVLLVFHNHLLELSQAIAGCTSPSAQPPPAFDPASRTAMQRYIRRRIKLLRNIMIWRRQAQQEVTELVTRLVGEVIRPILARTWEGGGQELASQVLSAAGNILPPDLAAFLRTGPGRAW